MATTFFYVTVSVLLRNGYRNLGMYLYLLVEQRSFGSFQSIARILGKECSLEHG
jgi:hypothetical protein